MIEQDRKNLQILLRNIAAGEKYCWLDEKGHITAFNSQLPPPENSEKREVEVMLQLEIYGEWPLSEANQNDWDRAIRKAFLFG